MNAPSRLRGGELEHLAAQRREHDRHRLGGRALELEAAGAALAGEHRPQELERLAHLRQRLLERDPVPALDDHVRRGAEAEHEAPVRRVGERRRLLREHRAPARVRVDDPGREADPLGVRGGEHQRREAVGPGRVAGPEVVVAELLGEPEVRRVVVQRAGRRTGASGPSGGRGSRARTLCDPEIPRRPPRPVRSSPRRGADRRHRRRRPGPRTPVPAARAGAAARALDRRRAARRQASRSSGTSTTRVPGRPAAWRSTPGAVPPPQRELPPPSSEREAAVRGIAARMRTAAARGGAGTLRDADAGRASPRGSAAAST